MVCRYRVGNKNAWIMKEFFKQTWDIIPLNVSVLAISLTQIEVILKILLLLITIFISIDKYISYKKRGKDGKK